jgi:hypothetical protein
VIDSVGGSVGHRCAKSLGVTDVERLVGHLHGVTRLPQVCLEPGADETLRARHECSHGGSR